MDATLYVRYSTDSETQRNSHIAQALDLQAYCESQGWAVRCVSFDKALSGKLPITRRRGLQQALKSLRRGDVFVIREISRLARNLDVYIAVEMAIERAGARLCVVSMGGLQATKQENPHAWAMRIIMAMMAEIERIEKAKLTSRQKLRKQAEGIPAGGSPPLGKRILNGRLVDDPEEQAAIAEILRLKATGKGIKAIVSALNSTGHKPRGKEWHLRTVKRFLSQRKVMA